MGVSEYICIPLHRIGAIKQYFYVLQAEYRTTLSDEKHVCI